MKRCCNCQEVLPESDFYPRDVRHWCKDCTREYNASFFDGSRGYKVCTVCRERRSPDEFDVNLRGNLRGTCVYCDVESFRCSRPKAYRKLVEASR